MGAIVKQNDGMDELDRLLLDIVQTGFPLCSRPYAELGKRVGIVDILLGLEAGKDVNRHSLQEAGRTWAHSPARYPNWPCLREKYGHPA